VNVGVHTVMVTIDDENTSGMRRSYPMQIEITNSPPYIEEGFVPPKNLSIKLNEK